MRSSTMATVTEAWLQDTAFVDDIAFILAKDKLLYPYLFDSYLEELVNLKNHNNLCLTPQGKLDVYHIEFKIRQAEKQRLRNINSESCQTGSYVV